MARGNGTSPAGAGPLTGRGTGFCAGYDEAGYMSAPGAAGRFAQGYGSFGRGRGFRYRLYAWGRWAPGYVPSVPRYPQHGMSREEEIDALKKQVKSMEEDLEWTRSHISDLESKEDTA